MTVTCWWKGHQIPCSEIAKYQGAETSGPLPPGAYGWTSTYTSGSTQTTTSGIQMGVVNIANQCSTGVVAHVGEKTAYVPPYRAISIEVDIPSTYTLISEGQTVGQGTITRSGEYISPQFCPSLTPSPTPGPIPSPSPSGGGGGTSGGLTTITTTTTSTQIPWGVLLLLLLLGIIALGLS